MYLEFRLPSGSGGMAAAHARFMVRADLDDWSAKYQIPYKHKSVKYTLRVFFEDVETYTFFGLTWAPVYRLSQNYRLVEPMDPPKSN